MNIFRIFLSLIGVLSLLVGLILVISGQSVDTALEPVIQAVGNDYLLVAILGGFAAIVMLVAFITRMLTGLHQSTPPNVETAPSAPSLDQDFNNYVKGLPSPVRWYFNKYPQQIKNRLQETAIRTIMLDSNLSREEVERQIKEGTWTDKIGPATYLSNGDVPVILYLKAYFNGISWGQYGALITAKEIVQYSEYSHESSQ